MYVPFGTVLELGEMCKMLTGATSMPAVIPVRQATTGVTCPLYSLAYIPIAASVTCRILLRQTISLA